MLPADTRALREALATGRGMVDLGIMHAKVSMTIDDQGFFCLRLRDGSGDMIHVPFSEADLKRLKREMIALKRARKRLGSLTLAAGQAALRVE